MLSTFEPKILCSKIVILFIIATTTIIYGQNKTIQTSGDVLLFAMPVTALTGSLIAGDYNGTWQFAKGFALNQAVKVLLLFRKDMGGAMGYPLIFSQAIPGIVV